MGNFIRLFIVIAGGAFIAGCSLEASIESLKEVSPSLSKATSEEIVPVSSQHAYTTKGYEVQGSVSYYTTSPEVITPQGYTVQTSVQSALFRN